jgi:hypothetical protein
MNEAVARFFFSHQAADYAVARTAQEGVSYTVEYDGKTQTFIVVKEA